MSSQRRLVSREDQFRSKKAGRAAAASASFEEKIEKLVQLQKISSEIARQTGRKGKEPWPIQFPLSSS